MSEVFGGGAVFISIAFARLVAQAELDECSSAVAREVTGPAGLTVASPFALNLHEWMTVTNRAAFQPWGLRLASWAFAIRIWIAAVIVALYLSFWLELESPSSAMLTVAILTEPTRGQALEKAAFRLIATVVGVVASIAITGPFSQTRDLLLLGSPWAASGASEPRLPWRRFLLTPVAACRAFSRDIPPAISSHP